MPSLPASRRSPWRRLLACLTLLGLLTVGSAVARADTAPLPPLTTSSAVTGRQVPRPAHTVVVVLENKDRSRVLGGADAPYLNELARRGANLTRSFGVTHPSQPNYLALFSGSQQGVTTNGCRDLGHLPNLGSQLRAAGLSFTGWSESLPRPGYAGCAAGRYQRKHSPWVSFANLPPEANQPFGAFPTDFARLPTVSFVTPDMCHDMHDCPVATGDAWLRANLDRYARWAMTHDSLLVVTFDENSGGSLNQVATVLVGQRVRPGLYGEWTNHYTLLRTLQDAYGLAPLGWAADASPLQSIWTSAPPPVTGSGAVLQMVRSGAVPAAAPSGGNPYASCNVRSSV